MTIVEEIEKTIQERASKTPDRQTQKLADFYEEMKREGMIIKKEYDLPSLDSIEIRRGTRSEIKFHRKNK